MSVQFILGEYPTQKRIELIDSMYQHLNENQKNQMIYLVPDNVKYEAETMILQQFMEKNPDARYSGMIRLQVFSFSRLAWYFLQDQPIYQHPQLTESGLAMLMKKILQEEEQNLTIFRGASQETGFIERLVNLFMELRNGKISPEDLVHMLEESEESEELNQTDFNQKLGDLSLLYEKYDEQLAGSYIEKEDLFNELIQYIQAKKEEFGQVTILIDHYEHFSALEQELIIQLAKVTKKLMISLTLKEETIHQPNDLNNPFYRPLKTYFQFLEELRKNGLTVEKNAVLGVNNRPQTEVVALADYWVQSSQPRYHQERELTKKTSFDDIEIWAAEDKETEIMHIATKILRMVSSEKYRYKDFQIMTRDLESYQLNIHSIFEENDVPFFIDHSETMAQHPILEFVESLLALEKRFYRIDDIFRFLRTELYCPDIDISEDHMDMDTFKKISRYEEGMESWRDKVDIAENVALAYGYQGNAWIKDEEWLYARFEIDGEFVQDEHELRIQEIANEVRETFKKQIVPFTESLDEVKTNREMATSLYSFMIEIGVVNQIQHWRDQEAEKGNLEEARKHEQAWETFIQLLDEFVEVLGDEAWDLDLFLSIIETGFEQATFSMVPPTIDQVLVTNFDLPKIQSKKVVFLIGLTDTQLPKISTNQSLLTDEDRELVDAQLSTDKYLATSGEESLANEPFAMYLALLQASEKLILSYPVANEESEENRISPYVTRIKNNLNIKQLLKYANAINKAEANAIDYLEFIGSKRHTYGQLVLSLRHAVDNKLIPEAFWVKLFEKIYQPNNIEQNRILSSLTHKNIPVPITEELAQELYGKDLYLSVSQLERFYEDPYSHFLLYGLRLQERRVQELSALDTGNFFHDALDLISREILTGAKDIATYSKEEINQLSQEISQMLFNTNKYRLSQTSYRMQFIFKQLGQTVNRMVWSIVNQSKRSKLRTSQTELLFGRLGKQKGVEGLTFPLKNNGKLYLRGKVDRIDTVTIDDQLYAGIVDYKSSHTTFNYKQMYYGLMLQMITYLDTVLTFSKEIFGREAKGIGAFYSRIHNPFIDLQKIAGKDEYEETLKLFKYNGLAIDNDEVLEALDTVLSVKETSPLYPFNLLASGKFSGGRAKTLLTPNEFNQLLAFNRERIIEAGNRILSGENQLAPYEELSYTPSLKSHRAISQFDVLLPENNYKEMDTMDKKEFFHRIAINEEDEEEEEEEKNV